MHNLHKILVDLEKKEWQVFAIERSLVKLHLVLEQKHLVYLNIPMQVLVIIQVDSFPFEELFHYYHCCLFRRIQIVTTRLIVALSTIGLSKQDKSLNFSWQMTFKFIRQK